MEDIEIQNMVFQVVLAIVLWTDDDTSAKGQVLQAKRGIDAGNTPEKATGQAPRLTSSAPTEAPDQNRFSRLQHDIQEKQLAAMSCQAF